MTQMLEMPSPDNKLKKRPSLSHLSEVLMEEECMPNSEPFLIQELEKVELLMKLELLAYQILRKSENQAEFSQALTEPGELVSLRSVETQSFFRKEEEFE